MAGEGGPSQQSFFDVKTMLAIGLTMLVWLAWQWHMQRKYPDAFRENSQTTGGSVKTRTSGELGSGDQFVTGHPQTRSDQQGRGAGDPAAVADVGAKEPHQEQEEFLELDFPEWSVVVSSRGMGFREVTLKRFNSREGGLVRVGSEVGGILPGETRLLGLDTGLQFRMTRVSANVLVGRAQAGTIEVIKKFEFEPAQYTINTSIEALGKSEGFLGVTNFLADVFVPGNESSFFAPNLEVKEIYYLSSEGEFRQPVAQDVEISGSRKGIEVVAVGSPYFGQAIVDRSDVRPELKYQLSASNRKILAALDYMKLAGQESLRASFRHFAGPRFLNELEKVDPSLARSIDFGFFGALGRPILRLMQWFYRLVGNWGVAIILLVLVVRLVVLPLHLMSYRSMKAMQAIQPKIRSLQERLKDDKEKLNREMMVLFKEHKVNPLGGCLPVLLQIPVFLALYQVIGHSVELYQAPFILWIHDLSLKDPYFVLPVLMGITMFFQQKVTPSTLDPTQAKVMLFLPVVFSFFMISLPSGLTLYFVVSGVFGIAQQVLLMNSKTKEA